MAFAQRVLQIKSVQFPPAFVLDVGYIKDQGWAVVEANAAWGSGIYGCDPSMVLKVLKRACLKTIKYPALIESGLFSVGKVCRSPSRTMI